MRRLGLPLALLISACANVESTTRVERGPLLRSFDRASVLEGGYAASATAEGAGLLITVRASDVCRTERVDEFAEEHITERTSNAMGPAISTGIVNVLASAVLFGVSFATSTEGDRSRIDASGHYGPSTRQYLQGASAITLGIGVPAVAVGLIALLRTGEEVKVERTEVVNSQHDEGCNERPVTGALALLGAPGERVELAVKQGEVRLTATSPERIPARVTGVRFAEREVPVDGDLERALTGWPACLEFDSQGSVDLSKLEVAALETRGELIRRCRLLRGAALDDALASLEVVLTERRVPLAPATWDPSPAVRSFDEARVRYAPTFTLSPSSAEVVRLDAPEEWQGKAVLLRGVLSERPSTPGRLVLNVGSREVLLQLPSKASFGGPVNAGARVEIVAQFAGTEVLGDRRVSLLRVVYLRAGW